MESASHGKSKGPGDVKDFSLCTTKDYCQYEFTFSYALFTTKFIENFTRATSHIESHFTLFDAQRTDYHEWNTRTLRDLHACISTKTSGSTFNVQRSRQPPNVTITPLISLVSSDRATILEYRLLTIAASHLFAILISNQYHCSEASASFLHYTVCSV